MNKGGTALISLFTPFAEYMPCKGLFCASSDERSHGKFAVVLARTENFVWVLEERRDNDRAKLWNKAASASSDENRGRLWT